MGTTTAADRREQAKEAYNAYLATCPSRELLDALSDKWVVLVMTTLSSGAQRYSGLRREIAGVSQKMLTQTLRSLESKGLVSRDVEPTVPVTVTYELTDLGQSLFAVVQPLKAWAEANIEAVRSAEQAYRRGQDSGARSPTLPA